MWEIVFDGKHLNAVNLSTNETFNDEYLLSKRKGETNQIDLNLLLNAWDLLSMVSRSNMKKEDKMNLNHLEEHVSRLLDEKMGK